MKTCKIKSSVFDDVQVEGVRFAVAAPEWIDFTASDDFLSVDIREIENLTIVAVGEKGEDVPVPSRILDSPIVNGGKPWIVAIVEELCQYAVVHGCWEADDGAEKFDREYDAGR